VGDGLCESSDADEAVDAVQECATLQGEAERFEGEVGLMDRYRAVEAGWIFQVDLQ
jgi:hypothetical protein